MLWSNQLAGALGLASWRAHLELMDYALAAPFGAIFAGAKQPTVVTPNVLGLNEVGVTDSVMATMWRCGPFGAAASTTGPAEKHHFGADLAIVDTQRKRLILYQAKLGSLTSGGDLSLKSHVPANHVRLLRRPQVTISGVTFAITGRLAIYQLDHQPYALSAPQSFAAGQHWPLLTGPMDAMNYYNSVLLPHSFSTCGVLAAAIPASKPPVKSIPASATWPWEFDAYHWAEGLASYVESPPSGQQRLDEPVSPRWVPNKVDRVSGPPEILAAEFASQLRQALRVPRRQQLHVLML